MFTAASEVQSQYDSTATQLKDGSQQISAAHREVHKALQHGNPKACDAHTSQARAQAENIYGKVELHDTSKPVTTEKPQPDKQANPTAQGKSTEQAQPTAQAKPSEQGQPAAQAKQGSSISDWWHNTVNSAENTATNIEHSVQAKAATVLNAAGHDAVAAVHVVQNVGDIGLAVAKGTVDAAEQTGLKIVHGVEKAGEWVLEHPKTSLAIGAAIAGAVVAEVATGGLATPAIVAAAAYLTPAVEVVGATYAAYTIDKAYTNVAAHGEIGTIMNQQDLDKTAAGRAQVENAKQQLAQDTGQAGFMLATMGIGQGIGLIRAASATEAIAAGTTATMTGEAATTAAGTTATMTGEAATTAAGTTATMTGEVTTAATASTAATSTEVAQGTSAVSGTGTITDGGTAAPAPTVEAAPPPQPIDGQAPAPGSLQSQPGEEQEPAVQSRPPEPAEGQAWAPETQAPQPAEAQAPAAETQALEPAEAPAPAPETEAPQPAAPETPGRPTEVKAPAETPRKPATPPKVLAAAHKVVAMVKPATPLVQVHNAAQKPYSTDPGIDARHGGYTIPDQ